MGRFKVTENHASVCPVGLCRRTPLHMRKFYCLFVLILAAALHAQTPQQLVQQGLDKQRIGDLEGAAIDYRQFLKIHPEATAIHSNLGAALAGLGQFEEAIAEYKIALRQSPGLVEARLNLALCYYKMGRIEDATTQLEKVHIENPTNHQAAVVLGDCYMRMDREKDVIRLLESERKNYPDDMAIAYLLGTALIREKRVEEGQVLVDLILRNGDSAEAHLMLGTAKMGASDFAGARDEFARAIALDPNLPEVHALYAKALMLTGDSDLSVEEFAAELRVDPFNFDANLQLGAMAKQEQNYVQARKYFERAAETRPGDPGVRYQLALLSVEEGALDKSRDILEGLVKEWPQFLEAHVSLALVYYRLKRPEDSKREREIVQKLTAEVQAKQPGVNQSEGRLR